MNFQLDSVIQVLLSTDNQRRLQAQKFIDQIPQTSFDQGIQAFVLSMNHQNQQIASLAALLLKKKYLDDKQNFSNISGDKLEFIVNSVKNYMSPTKSVSFLKRCCQVLVKVYTHIKQERELIHIIQALSHVDSLNIKLALMYLIQIICEYSFDDKMLMQYSAGLQSIFQKGLEDQNNQVKVAAFKVLTVFLASITKLELVQKFSGVLDILINKAIQLIKFDQQSGITALQSLNDLIQTHPKFVKPILNSLLTIFAEIMEAKALLTNLRITAMHGVLLLCTSHPGAVKKNQVFKKKYVQVYMKMLAEISQTSIQEWAEQLNDEIISKNDISMSTEQHLSQVLELLGNKFMFPLFINNIQNQLKSSQPYRQHAGLICMSILTQNCHQSFKPELQNIFGLIFPLLQTQNPRLIADIVIAMGYMSEQFAPQIQINYGEIILQFICKCLSHNYPKVQYKGALCIQNFEKGLVEHKDKQIKIMQKYMDTILNSLGKLFQSSLSNVNYIMLEAVLDTISTIAENNPFDNYYPTFMPYLKKIISLIGTDTQQKIMIRSKAVQTMGYLLYSIRNNDNLFKPDCQQIMKSLINMQQTLPEDDIIHKSIFIVYQNIVECLKQGFSIYSDNVMHFALLAGSRKINCQIVNEFQTVKDEPNTCMNRIVKLKLDMKIQGVKNLILNTDHLAQKIQASVLIASMAQFMGSNFTIYIPKIMPLVVEFLSYKHSRQVRNNAIQTCKYMIINCPQNQQKMEVLQIIWTPFLQQLSTVIRGRDYQQACSMVEVLSQSMLFMNQQMVTKLPEIMKSVISMVNSIVKEIQSEYKAEQMDQEQSDRLADETGDVQQVLEYVQKIMNIGKGNQAFDQLKKLFPSDYQFTNE